LSSGTNGNSKANIQDFNQLKSVFEKSGGVGFTAADINKDGRVNIFDYQILTADF